MMRSKLPFIKSLVIPIPSIKEQELIISKLDFLSAGLIHLYGNNQQKITLLDEFKKSILKKAFEGEL